MTLLTALAAAAVAIIAATAVTLILQQRRALAKVTSVLSGSDEPEFGPGLVHLRGKATRAPSYIPPTDEVVWRPRLRRLSLGAVALDGHHRSEYELSL
jgi:hypothetical protein